jgi:hypothetical protein
LKEMTVGRIGQRMRHESLYHSRTVLIFQLRYRYECTRKLIDVLYEFTDKKKAINNIFCRRDYPYFNNFINQ